MSTREKVLAEMRSNQNEIQWETIVSLLEFRRWKLRSGHGSHCVATSPKGATVTMVKKGRYCHRASVKDLIEVIDGGRG